MATTTTRLADHQRRPGCSSSSAPRESRADSAALGRVEKVVAEGSRAGSSALIVLSVSPGLLVRDSGRMGTVIEEG